MTVILETLDVVFATNQVIGAVKNVWNKVMSKIRFCYVISQAHSEVQKFLSLAYNLSFDFAGCIFLSRVELNLWSTFA